MSHTSGINGSPLLQTLLTQSDAVNAAKAGRAANGPTPAASAAQDSAHVSSGAAALLNAAAGSDVRMEKVAALQNAIASGTYSVSSSDVADKLVQSLLR